MVSMNSTSNMGIEMTSVASCLNDVVPLLATATGTATSIPSSSPPAATTLPTLDQRAAYISQWRQSIASSSDSHVQNEVETATGTAHIQGIPEVKTEDVTHGISTALGHEIQNTTPNQTEAEAQDPTLTQRPSSSSSSASSSSSSLQQPEAPHLSQKGSNFSLHASGSSSRGRMEKQCLPLSSASSQTSGSRSPSPARLGAEQKKNESRAVGSEGEKVKQTQTQTSGGDKKQLAEKMVDSVQSLMCSIWPSACAYDRPRSASPAASASSDSVDSQSGLVPLRAFIREILRRSKSSCGTLKCAEWYLTKLRDAWYCQSEEGSEVRANIPLDSPILCPRRAFLSALILAHKFLHDRVYSNTAWAKISGLDVREITKGELALAVALEHRLWFGKPDVPTPVEEDPPFYSEPISIALPAPASTTYSSFGVRKPCPLAKNLSAFSSAGGTFSQISPPCDPIMTAPQIPSDSQGSSTQSSTLSSGMPGLTLDSKSEWGESSGSEKGDLASPKSSTSANEEDRKISRMEATYIVRPSSMEQEQQQPFGPIKKRFSPLEVESLTMAAEYSAIKKRKVECNGQIKAIIPHL